jgi:DNA-binding NarL/FixJ family response regulator
MSAGLKLLLVEGHEQVRAALMRRLHRAPGVRSLDAVADLPSALSLLRDPSADLVLCEPQALAVDPQTAVRLLAATGRPIVVWTSSLREGEAAMLHAAGAAAVLLKEVNLTHLLRTIRDLCATPCIESQGNGHALR